MAKKNDVQIDTNPGVDFTKIQAIVNEVARKMGVDFTTVAMNDLADSLR